jgi:hypothetical protein
MTTHSTFIIHEIFGASFGLQEVLVIANQFFVVLYMHAKLFTLNANIYNS